MDTATVSSPAIDWKITRPTQEEKREATFVAHGHGVWIRLSRYPEGVEHCAGQWHWMVNVSSPARGGSINAGGILATESEATAAALGCIDALVLAVDSIWPAEKS